MSDPNQIETGDTVRVILSSDVFTGIVLYLPCATGDCWHIRDNSEHIAEKDRPLRYVQTFTEIVLLEKRIQP